MTVLLLLGNYHVSFVVMALNRPGGRGVQRFDTVNVLHVRVDELSARLDIVFPEVAFGESFLKVIARAFLNRTAPAA